MLETFGNYLATPFSKQNSQHLFTKRIDTTNYLPTYAHFFKLVWTSFNFTSLWTHFLGHILFMTKLTEEPSNRIVFLFYRLSVCMLACIHRLHSGNLVKNYFALSLWMKEMLWPAWFNSLSKVWSSTIHFFSIKLSFAVPKDTKLNDQIGVKSQPIPDPGSAAIKQRYIGIGR